MNRKLYMSILSLGACAGFIFSTGCGGSSSSSGGGGSSPTIAITANAGYTASATVGGSYGTFSATVTSNGSPASGVSVTFTAPSSGASGTFATSPAAATDTETTNSSGVATSQIFTANSTAGAFTVTASTSGATTGASFGLTNGATTVASGTYVFYMSGLEEINGGPNYYAIAGSVTIDANGNVLGGVQDYNDGFGITSPQPAGDTISATSSALTVNSSGQGTLTLTTNNINVGPDSDPGVETFAIQFVNSSHALITQFDGSATSSGSLDLQMPTLATPAGGFAFTISGIDLGYFPVAYGGTFTVSGGGFSGSVDYNDNGSAAQGASLSGTINAPGSFGRGTITGVNVNGTALALNYYIVGPEALRIIDVDDGSASSGTGDAAVGSAFGQGASGFSIASLGSSGSSLVFGEAGNPWVFGFAALGQFSIDGNGTIVSGVADDNEFIDGSGQFINVPITGTYTINTAGYGSLVLSGLNNVASVGAGIYLTDPALNLSDPNNTTGGGGALLLDLDAVLAGSAGLVVPQSDSTTASFAGGYAVGFQNFNAYNSSSVNANCAGFVCEIDMLAQGTMEATASPALSLTGDVSDPFFMISTDAASTGDIFSGTPATVAAGLYSLTLSGTIGGNAGSFSADIYQASGGQLFWLETDANGAFFGPVSQQGSLTGVPLARKSAGKAQVKRAR